MKWEALGIEPVGDVFRTGDHYIFSHEKQETIAVAIDATTAKLMAAAPKLVKAMEGLLNPDTAFPELVSSGRRAWAILKARAALAAAKEDE